MPLADAFVSNDAAVKLITEDVQPSLHLGGIDVKSLDAGKLAQLWAMMTEREFLEALGEFPSVHDVSDEGPWIFGCPAAFQSRLAALSEADQKSWAERWAPEFPSNIGGTQVLTMLRDLCTLSKLAESKREKLYIWNCL